MLQATHHGFSIAGSVNFNNVVSLRADGEKLISQNTSHALTIDLSAMTESDASCFSLLLCWVRYAHQKKCTLTFLHASSSLQRMSQLFKLREIFHG